MAQSIARQLNIVVTLRRHAGRASTLYWLQPHLSLGYGAGEVRLDMHAAHCKGEAFIAQQSTMSTSIYTMCMVG